MRILLSAYLDSNIGDDLFVDQLADRYRDHQFDLICENPASLSIDLLRHQNIRTVGLKQALLELYSFDVLVIVGGSIFQDIPAYYKYDFRRNALVTLARILGKAVFIIGCNIGPIHSKVGERFTRYCFALANAVSVRDSASFALLEFWRCRTPYTMGSDLIFSYPFKLSRKISPQPRRLGISVVNVNRPKAETALYVQKLAELARVHLHKGVGQEVTFFGFNGGGNGQNDSLPIAAIVRQLEAYHRQIKVQQYGPSVAISEFVESFVSCDYVVCSRFHSVVLALSFGIPFFPIVYSGKTLNLLHDIGYTGEVGHYLTMKDVDARAVLTELNRPERSLSVSRHYIESSHSHFAALDHFIAGKSKSRRLTAQLQTVGSQAPVLESTGIPVRSTSE
jgi:colanic acid/amylovoran biosynthesis protein